MCKENEKLQKECEEQERLTDSELEEVSGGKHINAGVSNYDPVVIGGGSINGSPEELMKDM